MKNNELKRKIIHVTFVKYDIIGVISKGFPDDEYQLEEAYLDKYITDNQNTTELDIYNELVRIIEDWFGTSPLHIETLTILKKMAEEIYIGIINLGYEK